MKRTKLIFVMLLGLSGLLLMPGCTKESAVPFTEKASFTIPALVAPASGGFISVTGTTVDLKWETTNADNAPAKFDVYFGSSDDPARVETNYTSLTKTVNVLPGVKYYWKIVATDANGVISRGPLWSFEVIDPAAAPKLKMTWTTDVKSVVGLDLTGDAAVNLRLLILKADKVTNAVDPINTTGFEEYAGFNTLADGTYYIVTDIASTINAGDFNKNFNISLNLLFSQRGSYSQSLAFGNAMTNKFNCTIYKTVLAKVTKAGNTYTMDKSLSYITPPVLTWKGTDATYPSQVTSTASCTSTTITGLGYGWMLDFWGEEIQTGGTCTYTVSGNNITIPLQPYCTTKYNGTLQAPYSIQGTGTIDNSGAYPVWTIHYDFIQSGKSIATESMPYGWPTPYFAAVITTNPAKSLEVVPQIDKPRR